MVFQIPNTSEGQGKRVICGAGERIQLGRTDCRIATLHDEAHKAAKLTELKARKQRKAVKLTALKGMQDTTLLDCKVALRGLVALKGPADKWRPLHGPFPELSP